MLVTQFILHYVKLLKISNLLHNVNCADKRAEVSGVRARFARARPFLRVFADGDGTCSCVSVRRPCAGPPTYSFSEKIKQSSFFRSYVGREPER